jgi:hypothetical protein
MTEGFKKKKGRYFNRWILLKKWKT